ncbi:WecB/TagA/CpsF family glycosyltransferase [Microbulbifer pacificus]|uniref:WecB/TagA/CpsF family glycosyltransferase n=1 Tax=Microbulbifer pacificus TaxID=407164 RepID=UPI00131A45DA|nr:WecB/TagA/CpsF family glycosyltransferase [Microbulbifer pacificus]
MKSSFNVIGREFNLSVAPGKDVSFLNFSSIDIVPRALGASLEKFNFGCDGGLLCLLMYLRGISVERYSFDFTSVANDVFGLCEELGKSIYLVGGEKLEAELFSVKLRYLYPRLRIDGAVGGYFSGEERANVLGSPALQKADVLIAGLGAGRQEQFLLDARTAGFKGFGITCGAFISQTANSRGTHYYPSLINTLRLRWFYRMVKEPHTIRRYLLDYPLNIGRFLLGKYRFTQC